jgi:hypothetical protein
MTEFTSGIGNPRRLSKREKVKRLSKKPVYSTTVSNENNIHLYPSYKYIVPKTLLFKAKEFWKIPVTISVTSSLEYKFALLSHIQSYTSIVDHIKNSLKRVRFTFPYEKDPFCVPPQIKSQITSYYSKQENEWNKVRGIYLKLFRFREMVKPLFYTWKIRAAQRNIKNSEDPVTLEIPKKPVYLIDINKRMSFVYDARSIKKAIEERLLFSDYMFSEPQPPVNLLTNEPLTYGQIVSICKQCKTHGEYSWILDELMMYGSNLKRFVAFNKQRLNLEAINTFFKKSTYAIRETVIDLFLIEADMADIPRYKITGFIRRYDTEPRDPLVQKWIRNTKEYYIAKELNNPVMIQQNDSDTEKLLNAIYLSTL